MYVLRSETQRSVFAVVLQEADGEAETSRQRDDSSYPVLLRFAGKRLSVCQRNGEG